MAWIESHDELPTHPKTLRAARKLKISPAATVGHLHFLWYWCLTHRPDGRLTDLDADDVADAAGWPDEGEAFVKALLDAGWLDDENGTLVVHDWWEGAGKTIKRRKYATTRQRRARESQQTDESVTDESHDSHDDVTRDMQTSHVADSDSDSDIQPPPGGNGKPPFVKRLADDLRDQGVELRTDWPTRHEAFQELLSAAMERLPEDDRHNAAMGIIAAFVQHAQGFGLTRESRDHTARLVRNHSPSAVLHGYGQALDWGAGCSEEYAEDPLALSRYVAGVLSKRGAA